jgi:hypothetical protein
MVLISKEHLVSSFILENAYNELNTSSFVRRGLWYTFYTIKLNKINWEDYLQLIHKLDNQNLDDLISIYLNKGEKICYININNNFFYGFLCLFFNINYNEIKHFFMFVRELIKKISYLENFNNSTNERIDSIFDNYLTSDPSIRSIYELLKQEGITKESRCVLNAMRIYDSENINSQITTKYLQYQLPPPPQWSELTAQQKIQIIIDIPQKQLILKALLQKLEKKNYEVEIILTLLSMTEIQQTLTSFLTRDEALKLKQLLDNPPTIEEKLLSLIKVPVTQTKSIIQNLLVPPSRGVFGEGKKNKRTKNRNKRTKNRNKRTKNRNKWTKK